MLGMGNCGRTDTSADLILAISKELYDSNGGSNCAQVNFISLLTAILVDLFYTVGVR
jgi:hypothetical protein